MIGQRGWIETMACSSKFIGFFVLLVFAQKASTLYCGWPGKPVGGILTSSTMPMPITENGNVFGRFVPTNRRIEYDYLFEEGQIVAYQCHAERQDKLKGTYFNRTCQADGRWSGTRPWCDINVAFDKTVNYAGISSVMSDKLMTDGLIDSEDPLNSAECAPLRKGGGAYLSIELGEDIPVRIVGILGKGGEGMNNLINQKVTLGTSINCQQTMNNASAFGFQCNREQFQASTNNQQGSTIRFDHGSNFTVEVCEVIIYANPTAVDCGEPEVPAFGEAIIIKSTNYQEAMYTCRNGYELQGKDLRTCYGRYWEGDQPICVESLVSSTTQSSRNTTDFLSGGGSTSGGGLDPFQIVLIVVCVALAIGLIVALVVLLKYGRLSCCGTHGSTLSKKLSKKKKPEQQDYQKVPTATPSSATAKSKTEEDNKREAAMAAAEKERRAEDEAFKSRLAYQNERPPQQQQKQQQSAPPASSITYAELTHEPTKRVIPDSPLGHSLPDSPTLPVQPSPIYAKVTMRNSQPPDNGNGTISSETESMETTATPPVRKTYIPPIYLKESPEVQMKQQALNNQLKQAVRISRNTDF